MSVLVKRAPAKVNLFLHITGKRPDGYHNLQTVFRLIDLYDTLIFKVNQQPINDSQQIVTLTTAISSQESVVTDDIEDNLIIKAARHLLAFVKDNALLTQAQIDNLPLINIHLDKYIPMGAGLGGGSSDCAATLIALNQLWQLGLSTRQLQTIGTKLGADVPIFLFGQDAIGEGIGELLSPITLPPQRYLLLKPPAHIETAQLFTHPDLRRDCTALSHSDLYQLNAQFTDKLSIRFGNVFEPIVRQLAPSVDEALNYLTQLSKLTGTTPRLTGSGSCVFLPFNTTITEAILQDWQSQAPCPALVIRTLT